MLRSDRRERWDSLGQELLYFTPIEGGSPFDALPRGNVEHISFSACNTALDGDYDGFKKLRSEYENLQSVQGWNGKAPLYEGINIFALNSEEREQQSWGSKKFSKGERSWYVKKPDGSWEQTNGKGQPMLIIASTGKTQVDADYI